MATLLALDYWCKQFPPNKLPACWWGSVMTRNRLCRTQATFQLLQFVDHTFSHCTSNCRFSIKLNNLRIIILNSVISSSLQTRRCPNSWLVPTVSNMQLEAFQFRSKAVVNRHQTLLSCVYYHLGGLERSCGKTRTELPTSCLSSHKMERCVKKNTPFCLPKKTSHCH